MPITSIWEELEANNPKGGGFRLTALLGHVSQLQLKEHLSSGTCHLDN